MAPEILVRGEGEASALPDRATLRITVDGEGASQEAAYGQAAQTAKVIDGVLDRYADALATRSATAMAVLPRTKWKKGESVRTGFRATRVTVVEVTDLARLGSLVADLAAAGAAAINGPFWQINPDNDVHRLAREKAIADGRSRASNYAEALGLTIEGVAWISEPGLRYGSDEYASVRRGVIAAGQREKRPKNRSTSALTRSRSGRLLKWASSQRSQNNAPDRVARISVNRHRQGSG